MGRCAKNHRFRATPDPDPKPGVPAGPGDPAEADRRAAHDRRASSQAGSPPAFVGLDRRQGPRRAAELPSSIWRQPLFVAVAIGLGIAAGLAGNQHQQQNQQLAEVVAPQTAPVIDAELLASVHALRDEAEALTLAQVELDETTHERWMPRVVMIERALDDPQTPAPLRQELSATITALECVGVLGDPSPPTCATLGR